LKIKSGQIIQAGLPNVDSITCLKYVPLTNSLISFSSNQTMNMWSLSQNESFSLSSIGGLVKDADLISAELLICGISSSNENRIVTINITSGTANIMRSVFSQNEVTSIRKLYDGNQNFFFGI
jgi:hypothetical protein